MKEGRETKWAYKRRDDSVKKEEMDEEGGKEDARMEDKEKIG